MISGVLDSLDAQKATASSSNGTSTPSEGVLAALGDATLLPDRFIATVSRDESVRKLRKTWQDHPRADRVTITNAGNVDAVKQSEVIILW